MAQIWRAILFASAIATSIFGLRANIRPTQLCMKAHIGVDAESGLVHTAGVTTGKVHDAKVMDNLIREDDSVLQRHTEGMVFMT